MFGGMPASSRAFANASAGDMPPNSELSPNRSTPLCFSIFSTRRASGPTISPTASSIFCQSDFWDIASWPESFASRAVFSASWSPSRAPEPSDFGAGSRRRSIDTGM